MITRLQNDIAARFRALTSDRSWPSPNGERPIRVVHLGYGSRRMTGREGDDYPFLATRVTTGSEALTTATITVIVAVGLYIPVDADGDHLHDDPSAAEQMIEEALTAVRRLGVDGNYCPFSLDAIKWQVGDENGDHPGPGYYVIAAELTFSREPILNTYTQELP